MVDYVSRGFHVVVLLAFFTFCSLSGAIWGLIVRAPGPQDPTIESIAVFPDAWDIATPTEIRQPGLASPTTTVLALNSTGEGLINYQFRTSSPPNRVAAHYIEVMQKRYDFRNIRQHEIGPGMQVLTFLRETTFRIENNKGGYDKEFVTVTISPESAASSLVRVEYKLMVFRWPPQ